MRVFRLFAVCSLIGGFSGPGMSAQDSFGIERGTGEIICTDDSDDTRSADDPSYAVAALWDQMVLGADVCGPQLTPIDGGTWGASKAVAGTDAEGRAATFRLYVLHDRFSWTLGSSTQIRDNDVPVPFSNVLSTPEFFERFCSAKAALALGAASHEGPTAPNHRLAAARGDIVARSLVNYREDCSEGRIPLIYAINLGEHQNTRAAGNTAPQRRVVIVAAEEMTVGVNLEQALRDALVTDTVVDGFSVGDYDLFVVTPF